MKKLLLIALLLVIGMSVSAVPAKKEWRRFSQPDGTEVELMLVGDEYFHYYITRDNVPVVEEDSAYYYAKATGSYIVSSGIIAHESNMRTAEEKTHLYSIEDIVNARQQAFNKEPRRTIPMKVGEEDHFMYEGSKKGLIILANFSDMKFFDYDESDNGLITRTRYDRIANEVGYTNEFGAIGSVHDYFYDQSYGKFDLTFDVVGPINLEKTYSYYGRGNDQYAPLMIVESCIAADTLVNFNDYDWNGDGVAEEVFVLYAGYGAATGGGTNTVWPHMSSIEDQSTFSPFLNLTYPFFLDGVEINVYACSNELFSSKGTTQMGLGVFCHEFSHCLGLPDFYDTGAGTNYGLSHWDVLDQGSYNGPNGLGWVPAGYSSYERWYAGWIEPSAIETDSLITDQKPINENGQAYIIYNDNHKDEYYILENRNQTGWDTYVPCSGLLIYHVDYDAEQWKKNSVNSKDSYYDHERMTLFHANSTKGCDAYPYEGNDSLTDNSEPAAILYNENLDGTFLMHKPITEIARDEATGEVSFRFENKNNYDAVEEVCRKQGNGYVTVYSLDGKMVAGKISLSDVGKLPKGMYLLRGNDGNSHKILIE